MKRERTKHKRVVRKRKKQLIEAKDTSRPIIYQDSVDLSSRYKSASEVGKSITVKPYSMEEMKTPRRTPKGNKKRTRWSPDFLRTIYHMALLGAKEDEICEALNVHVTALSIWNRTRPLVV